MFQTAHVEQAAENAVLAAAANSWTRLRKPWRILIRWSPYWFAGSTLGTHGLVSVRLLSFYASLFYICMAGQQLFGKLSWGPLSCQERLTGKLRCEGADSRCKEQGCIIS